MRSPPRAFASSSSRSSPFRSTSASAITTTSARTATRRSMGSSSPSSRWGCWRSGWKRAGHYTRRPRGFAGEWCSSPSRRFSSPPRPAPAPRASWPPRLQGRPPGFSHPRCCLRPASSSISRPSCLGGARRTRCSVRGAPWPPPRPPCGMISINGASGWTTRSGTRCSCLGTLRAPCSWCWCARSPRGRRRGRVLAGG